MIVKHKPEEFQSYLEDTSNLKGRADILYIPETAAEIPDIVNECFRKKIPLTCSGAHTGTTGGCVPFEGALISFEKLNHIHTLDREKRTVTLEAGVTLAELEAELKKAGLSLRAQPTESLACVGAAASTCASGVRGFRYGSIRDYIIQLKGVLPDATPICIRRGENRACGRRCSLSRMSGDIEFALPEYAMPAVKNQAGYFAADNMDVIDLFIGSEGTLCLITELTLTVQKRAEHILDMIVFFETEAKGLQFVYQIKQLARQGVISVASLEFLDGNSLSFLTCEYHALPLKGAAVYIEHEAEECAVDESLEFWQKTIAAAGVQLDTVWFADSERERERIFSFRHRLPQLINEFLREHEQRKVSSDIAVPDAYFDKMYALYSESGKASGIGYVNFGHIGENHLHFNFLPRNETEYLKAKKIMMTFMERAVSFKGTVSAEHGIGKIKKPYLKLLYGAGGIRQMMQLKKRIDPACILGMDTLFEKNELHNVLI